MDWKKLWKNLLFPPRWLLIVLSAVCTAALIFVFVNGLEQTVAAYLIYALSFYTLSVVCVYFSAVLPSCFKNAKQRVYANPFGERYLSDAHYRTRISLFSSLCINLLYVGINVLSFVLYRSMWFICLAVYYSILAIMRFLLSMYAHQKGFGTDRIGELRRTVLCYCILLTINFALSGAVLMMLYQNKGYEYHGMMIYVMAAYAFYITAHAVAGLVKYRRYSSPVMTMSKVISLSAALVSMLSLETAMFSQFGQDMDPYSKWLMIVLTGAGVSLCVVVMSVYMIIKSVNEIKTLKGENNGKQR